MRYKRYWVQGFLLNMTTMQINTDIIMHPGNMGRLLDVKIKKKNIESMQRNQTEIFIVENLKIQTR